MSEAENEIQTAADVQPTIARREVTNRILKAFHLRADKNLGQNFLVEESVVARIAAAAELTPDDRVLEIGPGIGTLTQALARTGAQVTSVELDQRLLPVLKETVGCYANVRIVHGDILKTDIPALMGEGPFKVAANLPYYITTPIIMNLLEQKLPLERLVVMVQKEVAERMTASPGSRAYGAISVAMQYYTDPRLAFIVKAGSFLPAPKVDSAVLVCKRRTVPPVDVPDEKIFFRVVAAAFFGPPQNADQFPPPHGRTQRGPGQGVAGRSRCRRDTAGRDPVPGRICRPGESLCGLVNRHSCRRRQSCRWFDKFYQ
jgi:16S rRNA (adenine1518-N6/adenine1519-N6)-dimethyltransferase